MLKMTLSNVKPVVLCVDRDDDIGRNVGIKGPIVGREKNLEVARKLALVDPADTDVNALYGALKLAYELDTEVVTLTGDEKVGLISDREISKQLEKVIKELKPNSVIFVSDGLDDEQVMPIIQSRVKIDSVETIVVRQSKELEKAYFKLTHFLKEVTEDPNLARLIFGIPGIVLLLLAVFGTQALSLTIGVIGVYLIIKGFGWEEEFFQRTSEFLKSLSVERISTLIYFIAFITFTLGLSYAYESIQVNNLNFTDFNTGINTLAAFIHRSNALNLITVTFLLVILARIVDEWAVKNFIHVRRYLILAAFIVLINVVLDAGAEFMIVEEFGFGNFIFNGVVGVLSLWIWTKLTDYFFSEEIEIMHRIMRDHEGKEIVDSEGNRLGRASKAVIINLELKELRYGRKTIPKKDIASVGDKIVVKTK
ncbi:MAG: DUF373 family protein [Candidatus Altiarchaeales archaeon]|nr:DUF373 family protein [Candidatus Altiarchaeales archaeon]MBD3416573.1 DUF373 family protein [Candidatus Altiarchaeales archaeon]